MLRTSKLHKYLFWSVLTLVTIIFPVHVQAQFADFGLDEKLPTEKLTAKGYLSSRQSATRKSISNGCRR